jgi:hypothetical protein
MTILVDSNGKDLIPVTLWEGQDDTVMQLAKKLNEKVQRAKENKDKVHNEMTKIFLYLPTYLLGFLLTVGSYLGQNVGMDIGPL